MESQPQNPEFRINPENSSPMHLYIKVFSNVVEKCLSNYFFFF